MSNMSNVIRAFEHLIELLEEESIDIDIIHAVEEAKETMLEEYHAADTYDADS